MRFNARARCQNRLRKRRTLRRINLRRTFKTLCEFTPSARISNRCATSICWCFQNQEIDFIVKIANQLQLYAVQLHGAETEAFITALRQQLPKKTRKFGKLFRSILKPKVRSILPII